MTEDLAAALEMAPGSASLPTGDAGVSCTTGGSPEALEVGEQLVLAACDDLLTL